MNPSSAIRRLAIYGDQNLDGVPTIGESSQSLRSLSLHVPLGLRVEVTGPNGVIDFNNLNHIRFLFFERVDFEGGRLPTEMSKLTLLKFLVFSGCTVKELPLWIGDWPLLQALHLHLLLPPGPDPASVDLKIPNVLRKIKGLKYLFLPPKFVAEEKLELDCLYELETLENFHSKNCQLLDVSKLQKLRRVSGIIYGKDSLCKFIDAKCLDHTSFVVYDCDFTTEEGMALLKKVFKSSHIHTLHLQNNVRLSKFPDFEPDFFPKLGELYLIGGFELPEDTMNTLEKLSNLRKLIFYGFVGAEMTCHANGFPQLRYLRFTLTPNLKTWKVEKGAMPRLLSLEFNCPQLDMIPDGIKFITTLQRLIIDNMPEAFKKRVEEGGEDFDKVRHVRSIIKEY